MAVNSVNSSSGTSTTSGGVNRMPGLASGLDTEALVKQMSSYAKAKLNAQKQNMEKLQWKQDSYRSVISKITAFKDTYFNLLKSDTNISSSSLFGTRAATSTSTDLVVTAAANALEATHSITDIISKAKSAEISSSAKAVEGIKLDFNTTQGQSYKIKFNLDGLSKEITFAGGTAGTGAGSTQQNLLDALGTAFTGSSATFSIDNNTLKVGDSVYTTLTHTFGVSGLTTTDKTGLTALGLTDPMSSKLALNTKLDDVAFGTQLKGNGFTFDINGVKFRFDKTDTVNNVIDTINKSTAGVKVRYDSIGGKFAMESTQSGNASSLTINQTSGNLLSAMFGSDKIAESSSLSSSSLISNGIKGTTPADGTGFGFEKGVTGDIKALLNQKVKVTINGVEKDIALWTYNEMGNKNDFSKKEGVLSQLNSQLTKAFGSSAPTLSYDEASKQFTITGANKADEVTINATNDPTGGSQKLLTALGFNSTNNTNIVGTDAKLFPGVTEPISANISFGGGTIVHLDNNSTIGDLVNGSNGYVSYEKGFITLKGVDLDGTDAAGKTLLSSLFHEPYNYPGVPPTHLVGSYESKGSNAIMTVDGNTITSNSNSFTVDGTTIDISNITTGAKNIDVKVTNDTSKALAAIKSFVTDYNALVGDLNKEITTKYDKSYQPLTDEQREGMSDKQIELWESKAKTGLLSQDTTVNKFITELRSAVSGFSSFGKTLYDIGIKTSTNYKDNGKLEFNEASVKKALTEDPEAVSKFFTDPEKGLSAAVTKALNRAVKTTGDDKGTLVALAGVENTSTVAENRISKQLATYKTLIETLQTKYEAEQTKYWKQFTNLEKVMSSYNSQSSWLTQQFSGQ